MKVLNPSEIKQVSGGSVIVGIAFTVGISLGYLFGNPVKCY
ncbi:hypothetical protein [Erwinia sorbitola]|nr:hypothetical protein [Erwinia sorbitola]